MQISAESFKRYSAEVCFCLVTNIEIGYKLATIMKYQKKKSPVNH